MPTDFAALDALYPLPPDDLPRQWVLSRDGGDTPAGWAGYTRLGWHLGAHPDAQVCELQADDASPIGWVLEPLAQLGTTDVALPEGVVTLPVGPQAGPAEIERALYGRDESGRANGDGLAGQWAAVVMAGTEDAPVRRVYLSATGSVVCCPRRRTVATSHNLVADVRRHERLSTAVDPLATGAYFPFGLTAFEGLGRLLPNHHLDLDTFGVARHWPVGGVTPVDGGEAGAAAIVDHSRRLVGTLASAFDTFRIFLSAGRDSRAVLAVVAPFVAGGTDVVLATSVGTDPRVAHRPAGVPPAGPHRRPSPRGDAARRQATRQRRRREGVRADR